MIKGRFFEMMRTTFQVCFTLFFIFTIICVYFFNVSNNWLDINMDIVLIILFLLILTGSLFIYMLKKKRWDYTSFSDCKVSKWFIAVVVLLFILQVCMAISIVRVNGWDVFHVYTLSQKLHALPVQDVDLSYINQFPNNHGIVFLFLSVWKVVQMMGGEWIPPYLYLIAINLLVVDTAIFLTYRMCKKIYGRNIGILSFFVLFFSIGLSPWIVVPYTDTLSILFPIGTLYMFFDLVKTTHRYHILLKGFLLGTVFTFGYYMKPTNVIVGIAILIVIITMLLAKKIDVKSCLKKVPGFIIGVVCVLLLFQVSIHAVYQGLIVDDRSIPMTHFLMMGTGTTQETDGYFGYGTYSASDYKFTHTFGTKKEKIRANLSKTKERLLQYGIKGYAKFLMNKLNFFMGDGTFFWQTEGGFFRTPPPETGKIFQEIFYKEGRFHFIFVYAQQLLWLLCLLAVAFSSFSKYRKNQVLFISQVTIIGIICFLLLFEARSRYLMNHLPFFVIVAMSGVHAIFHYDKIRDNMIAKKEEFIPIQNEV